MMVILKEGYLIYINARIVKWYLLRKNQMKTDVMMNNQEILKNPKLKCQLHSNIMC